MPAPTGEFRTLRPVILRLHSALIVDGGRWTDDVALFTSDPVDLGEFAVTRLDGGDAAGDKNGASSVAPTPPVDTFSPSEFAALVPVRRSVGDDRRLYFGLGPAFVRDHSRGTFRSDQRAPDNGARAAAHGR